MYGTKTELSLWSAKVSRKVSLREKYPYLEFFWSVFTRIKTESRDIRISLHIQSEWGKMRARKTPNRDTFHALYRFTSLTLYPTVLLTLN